MAQVIVKGKDIGYVHEDLSECPEDAYWHRALSDIFWKGVEAGLAADSKDDITITDIDEIY